MLQTDKGLDVIVEMLADVNLDKDLELVEPNGRITVSAHLSAVCTAVLSVQHTMAFSFNY